MAFKFNAHDALLQIKNEAADPAKAAKPAKVADGNFSKLATLAGGPADVSAVPPDLDAFEGCAAIAEHDGGQTRAEAEALGARDQGFDSADDLHRAVVEHWHRDLDRLAGLSCISQEGAEALKRAQDFLREGWALQAACLGWDEIALFGVCPRARWARQDRRGAAFGPAVQAVTEDAVVYAGSGLRRQRALVNNDGGATPIWELVDWHDRARGHSGS